MADYSVFDISGKTALVTGAASGLGADCARTYARAGANVALLDVNEAGAREVADEINDAGVGRALAIPTDVTVDEQVRDAVEKAKRVFGQVDIVLNDAGTFARDSAEDFDDQAWNHVFEVNLKGILRTAKYTIPDFKKRGWGRIVNIASIAAVKHMKSEAFMHDSYASSKAAVAGLTKEMAAHYAKYGISVNAIAPGIFRTPITENEFSNPDYIAAVNDKNPSNRYGKTGDLDGPLLFLSSDAARYVQGQLILVDGGMSLV